ncbi:MAG TPA: hypothetical protein VFS08_17430 [Gemmatimonadaceae bacterium]|nr:hypothetical protein [Gemmatimonadaceae bacterium]
MTASRSLLLLLCLAACAPDRVTTVDPAAPGTRHGQHEPRPPATSDDDDPTFLQAATDAPTIANPVVQFWAKRGEERTAEMYYHAAPGERDSVVFLSLRVREESLVSRPDGTPLARGDSLLITITLVDPTRLVVDCQPSGLRFSPRDPARLKMSFAHADDDVNGDGTVNGGDRSLTTALALWRRESSTEPWERLVSEVEVGVHEVEAEIGGFTGYAIAW